MATVTLLVDNGSLKLECRALTGEERLGEAIRFELLCFSPDPIEIDAVLAKPCALRVVDTFGERAILGVCASFSALATSNREAGRRYRVSLRSSFDVLRLKRRSRVFQRLSVPDIIKKILTEGVYADDAIAVSTTEEHAPREYVVQYAETDAAFVRRLCEEEGLYFRFDARDGDELFSLEDTSSGAPSALSDPLPLVDEGGLITSELCAFTCSSSLRRRPGKVTLRDYNDDKPAVTLEGVAKGSIAQAEESIEVYEAPGRFRDPDQGAVRAERRLQSLRADAQVITFSTTATTTLTPGTSLKLECGPSYTGAARPEGDFFITALRHAWTIDRGAYGLRLEVIPLATSFRLPRVTPRPRIAGLQSAMVTGPAGQEIHTDEKGRVHVRFPWDLEGPLDDKSSLPVRVLQPNMPGSMLLPRCGWEVLVAFEDGDPDRPYVIGRSYNAKQPPPQSLPANKTAMSLATWSSPGGGAKNAIRFEDGAGREHIAIDAGFGMSTSVANNRLTQTVKVEELTVKGGQTLTVGANEDISVTQAYLVDVGSQSATVGGAQNIYVKGDIGVSVGSEAVMVGAALIEKVGDPVAGALNLAKSAALAGVGQLGVGGMVASTAAGLGMAVQQGGLKGGAMAGLSMLAGMVPGGDAVVAAVTSPAPPAPWQEAQGAAGAEVAGGGAAPAESDSGAAKGPGPGHRNTFVKGALTELIGGSHNVITPGAIQWTTAGPSTRLIGGSHSTKTLSSNSTSMGASNETVGSLKINAGSTIVRDVKGPINTTIAGALTSKAGGKHAIKVGGALTLKVAGSLNLKGAIVSFVCGSAAVSSSPGGLLIQAGTITLSGSTKQSGGTGHE